MDDVPWRILNLVAKRGHAGARREDLFREIPGVVHDELERGILALEKDGHVNVEGLSDGKFLVTITDKGSSGVKEEYARRLKAYRERVAAQRDTAGPRRT